ncbi:MAG: diacylglycerol kinase family lipid kinase [Anaerolineales bacterium]|nr:diacylglycerol kinase family lipid kinase [Anaerolineales bacterium]
MSLLVIYNPYSGRWNALKKKQEVEDALNRAGVKYELILTEGPGHAMDLAARAVNQGFDTVIAAGGDGTISEVVNGLAVASENLLKDRALGPLGIIPLGSANDMVDNLGLPKDIDEAAKVIASGNTKLIDLCKVNNRYFDNNSAIGLEPFITLIQQRIKRLKGTSRYLVATLMGVYANPSWKMRLTWENGDYYGPITLVTVGNSPRTGGVFYVTPHANPCDGLLTFVFGFMPTRRQTLQLLPRTMKPGRGNYVEHPDIHEINTPWLKINSETPTPMHADGEIQSEAILDLDYTILPERLSVLVN